MMIVKQVHPRSLPCEVASDHPTKFYNDLKRILQAANELDVTAK
jgi:hypothetical protein